MPDAASLCLLACLVGLTGGCGGASSGALIIVSISGVPEGTRTLRATSYLNGQREQDPAELDGRERQLVIRLPPEASGLYRLEIDAIGTDGCSFAQGQAETAIGGARRVELSIALGSPGLTVCTLAVRKLGLGQGYIESDPAGIHCGSGDQGEGQECTYRFQKGVTVTLTARPSSRAVFEGWVGACSGVASCSVWMIAPRSVSASFGVRAQD